MLMSVSLSLLAAAISLSPQAAPGKRILAADYSTKRIAIIKADGGIEWQYAVRDVHDLHMLPNGNVLFQTSFQHIVEVDPKSSNVVWEYDSGKQNGNEGKPVEVHAIQRLPNGDTMIAESGPARIIEVNRDGKITHEIKLKVNNPGAHTDTRLVRRLKDGHYLVCHERDGTVREYSHDGTVVWEYEIPLFGKPLAGGHGPEAYGNSTFGAVRLKNGNTLITTGNGHGVIEVTKDKRIVWQIQQNDLKDIVLAWVTTLQVLPNGNIILGNCHAGPDQPQLVEITKSKQVVWTWKDFTNFGNALSNSQVLDLRGSVR